MLALDTTGRTGYLITCKKLSVSPCSIFLRHAMEDKLKLKYYGLRPRDTRALAMGFRDNTFITNVDLSYNCIGTEGIIYIGRALRENQHISDIVRGVCTGACL
ncbi:leucine-rich repeat-containing protein 74A-like [Babylonia areolata]|uniref:leucine-rich repeat-containing protein 74A-like n=1 Tax=Babylonia areolata TaxID=304850 RepID=UPI003FD1FF5E